MCGFLSKSVQIVVMAGQDHSIGSDSGKKDLSVPSAKVRSLARRVVREIPKSSLACTWLPLTWCRTAPSTARSTSRATLR